MTELLDRAADLAAEIDEFDEALVCRAVVPVTHDVTSFVLESPHGRRFAFRAGQYVTVAAVIDERRVERCYTISSPATCTDRLTITVKRVPGGPMSNWLHEHLAVGDALEVTGPLGVFTREAHPAGKYLFLSAGSGITPLMSMTRTLLDDAARDIVFVHSARSPRDIVFVHSARSPRDIVFRAELDTIAATQPGVRVAAVCENDAPDERWPGLRGRLTLEQLLAVAPDLAEREVFTCGPQPYMASVRELLRRAGVDPARCHEESFELAGVAAATVAASTGTGFTVEFARSGRTVECPAGSSILAAGLAAGVALASSCGEGICGTCKSPLLAGRVDMAPNGGIRPREIAQGKILLCCSTPLENLRIDV